MFSETTHIIKCDDINKVLETMGVIVMIILISFIGGASVSNLDIQAQQAPENLETALWIAIGTLSATILALVRYIVKIRDEYDEKIERYLTDTLTSSQVINSQLEKISEGFAMQKMLAELIEGNEIHRKN